MTSGAAGTGISGPNTYTDNRQGEKMINEMMEFLSLCPFLDGKEINVNYLDHTDKAIMLEPEGKRQVLRRYADGGLLKSALFRLVIRRPFCPDISENKKLANELGLIEKWIEEQNLNGNLPIIRDARRSVSVGVAKCFEITKTDRNSARYEAKIELIYLS